MVDSDELTTLEKNALAWVLFCDQMKPWLERAWDDPEYNKHNVIAKVLGTMHTVGVPVKPKR